MIPENEGDLLRQIYERFGRGQAEPKLCPPLVLAYVGDGIYDLVVRTVLAGSGMSHVDRMNRQASAVCRASAQAAVVRAILDRLTEEEAAIYRRGRNAKPATKAKNATMSDYRHATGLEALCGYLYLNGELPRLLELLEAGFAQLGLLQPMKAGKDGGELPGRGAKTEGLEGKGQYGIP